MKRAFCILVVLSLLGILFGCNAEPVDPLAEKYQDAISLMETGDYEKAIALFKELGEYEDAAEKTVVCRYEAGKQAVNNKEWDIAIDYLSDLGYLDSEKIVEDCKREKAMKLDYEFLDALEQSVLRRLSEPSLSPLTDRKTLVYYEYALLRKYNSIHLHEADITAAKRKYFEGLNLQKESFRKEYYESQVSWQAGMVKRYEALNDLYKNYGFMQDNPEFVAAYILQLEDEQSYLSAMKSIANCMFTEIEKIGSFEYYAKNISYTTLTNNTKYRCDIEFKFHYADANGKAVGSSSYYVSDIDPHSSFRIYVDCSDAPETKSITTDIMIYNIRGYL